MVERESVCVRARERERERERWVKEAFKTAFFAIRLF
jgi:hypothetical protein